MKPHAFPPHALAIAAALALSIPAARAEAPDPIPSADQIFVLLKEHYATEERSFNKRLEPQLRDKAEYLASWHLRLSEIMKVIGDKKQTPPIVSAAAPASDQCKPGQMIFVRRDGSDTFQLGSESVPLAKAKGAALSFTQDQLSNTNTVTINGRVEAIAWQHGALRTCVDGKLTDPPSTANMNVAQLGYTIAAFVDAQGTTNSPPKKGETSALQAGVDMQASIYGGPLFDAQYLTLTPYYQTDFRGLADIQGITASWAPIMPSIHLGGRIRVPDPYVDWFWTFQATLDERHVTNPGVTGLTSKSYAWIGAVAYARAALFPDLSSVAPSLQVPFSDLVNRFYVDGTMKYYWDANSGLSIHLFEAELGYNINTDGSSSIAVKYDRGTDKDTLQPMQKYVVSLNYKF